MRIDFHFVFAKHSFSAPFIEINLKILDDNGKAETIKLINKTSRFTIETIICTLYANLDWNYFLCKYFNILRNQFEYGRFCCLIIGSKLIEM